MPGDVKIQVKGGRELRAAFKQIDAALTQQLKEGFKAIAEMVAAEARGRVPKRTGTAAGSIKARGTTRGGAIAFGGSKAPYYPWLDFGGAVGRNRSIKRDFISEGRYVYPSIRDKRSEIIDRTDDLIEDIARKAGFETRGDN